MACHIFLVEIWVKYGWNMGETLWNMLWIAEEELAKKKAKKVGEIAQSQNLKIIWSTSCSKWNSMSFPDNLHICPVQCPGIFSLAAPPAFLQYPCSWMFFTHPSTFPRTTRGIPLDGNHNLTGMFASRTNSPNNVLSLGFSFPDSPPPLSQSQELTRNQSVIH